MSLVKDDVNLFPEFAGKICPRVRVRFYIHYENDVCCVRLIWEKQNIIFQLPEHLPSILKAVGSIQSNTTNMNCETDFLLMFVLTHFMNIPCLRNRTTRRKHLPFGRASTVSRRFVSSTRLPQLLFSVAIQDSAGHPVNTAVHQILTAQIVLAGVNVTITPNVVLRTDHVIV